MKKIIGLCAVLVFSGCAQTGKSVQVLTTNCDSLGEQQSDGKLKDVRTTCKPIQLYLQPNGLVTWTESQK